MLKNLIVVWVVLVLGSSVALADSPPQTEWIKTFGGGEYEWGRYVQETENGGTIIVGETMTYGPGHFDIWLIKTDSSGETQWSKTFGGLGEERCGTVQQTADGGFVIAGTTTSFGNGSYDIWLIKTDSEGEESWSRTYGGASWDWGYEARQTADGGYIVVGYSESYGPGASAAWLIKTDADGAVTWSRTFGGSSYDWGESVRQTADQGYVIAGNTYSSGAGGRDAWLIRTDSAGDTVWTETFGGSNSDGGRTVERCLDGGFVFTGYTRSFGAGGDDVWLVKTDAHGATLWTRTFGGSGDDGGEFVLQTVDGGYLIAGHTESFSTGAGDDFWLIKTDDQGQSLWTLPLGDDGHDWARSVQETADGGILVVGDTFDYWNGAYDILLMRLAFSTSSLPGIVPLGQTSINCHPNPFNPSTVITFFGNAGQYTRVTVHDLRGQEVAVVFEGIGQGRPQIAVWHGVDQPSGVYFLRVASGSDGATAKVVLIK